jgi:uncharacterized phage protein (TIGR01671 family)
VREIKFRGKRVDNGEWVYGSYSLIPEPNIMFYNSDNEVDCASVDPGTLGQYTGIRDMVKTDIYEGHIIKQTYHVERGSVHDGTEETFDGHHIGAVVIIASQGVCMKFPLVYEMEADETNRSNQYKKVAGYRCEVIGNIHENPELLAMNGGEQLEQKRRRNSQRPI